MHSIALRQTAQPVPSGSSRERNGPPCVRRTRAVHSSPSVTLVAAGVLAGIALLVSGLLLGDLLVSLLGLADVAIAARLGAVLVTMRSIEATE